MRLGVTLLRPVDRGLAQDLRGSGLGVSAHLSWAWTEHREGQWDLRGIERFLAPLLEEGVEVEGILGPALPHLLPAWFLRSGGLDAQGSAGRFVDALARLAASLPHLRRFRVEDEADAAAWEALRTRRRQGRCWWRPGFAMGLLLDAVARVRSARPDAQLSVTVRAGAPWTRTWLQRLARADPAIDGVGLARLAAPPLPGLPGGEEWGDRVELARGLCPWPVHISRCGLPLGAGSSPRDQAAWLCGAVSAARAAGATGLTWASLRDQAHDDPVLGYWSPARERRLGLRAYDGAPRPAWEEMVRLARGRRFS